MLMTPSRTAGLRRRAPLGRMLTALVFSLLVHFLLFSDRSGSSAAPRVSMAPMPLQARLEATPAVLPPFRAGDIPLADTASQSMALPRRVATAAAAARVPGPSAGAAAGGADLRFYLARELDQYPAPLLPLVLDNGHGTVRLWVNIDQTGQVIETALINADPPGALEKLARERVLATPFAPARRDGRPVKSRILLVLGRDA